MSQETQKSGGAPTIVLIVIGVVLMLGGANVSANPPAFLAFQKDLEAQGIPLDLGKTVAAIGVFLILFPVIKTFFLKPLQEAIDQRTQSLESTFADAENLRTEMAQMKSDYEKRITQTEEDARNQIQSQIKEAQDLRTQMVSEANARVEEMQRKAREEMESERNKVLAEVRLHVADLSLQATEKLLNENVDNDRNRRLIDEFIATAEVPGR
ncbi:MAG TPA: F0F1 ATP synthase subunit B [Fimbriimonadaceae bacterium]|nr:ATP synthase F0 subunit B [Armatimonadota bacterium]HRD32052.1 F0F1 ATP synthase subunit B [Fimbriimonadaceae bacterium]HRE93690.1 F0F1 ATP synthase subunit B [Fimbriimonadaceae bacterium]HRI74024.1 F0F1 ATP synthase subunit B [Fimbriimonadaceae bacterium]